MSKLVIDTPEVFLPLLADAMPDGSPVRYRGAHGGRGSAKSHHFAGLAVERGLYRPGTRGLCVREVQKSLKESSKRLIEDKIRAFGVEWAFDAQATEIKAPGGGVITFAGMQDHTADSIKSFEGYDWAWIEEGQRFSKRSLELLRPTIRKPGSEIWASWNPRLASDAVDAFLRGKNKPEGALVVRANYRDNPFFPAVLEQERLYDERHNRDRYAHIWLGEYEPMAIGAIWDRQTIEQLRRSKDSIPRMERIVVSVDPAVSAEDGSNEHGITVLGVGEDQRGYVLDDVSMQGSPRQWADRAVAAYDRYDADAIVIERNQGGDMCRHTLQSVRPGIRIVEVVATRGKHVRAEPVSALYHLGRISHAGTFPELEDQMCLMTAAGYEGEGSPDRCDALVWGFTELFPQFVRQKDNAPSGPEQSHFGEGGWMA